MIRPLYNNFRPFRNWINGLITEKLTAYDNKANLELIFILDHPGPNKYYRYTDEFNIPLDRYGYLQDYLTQMSAKLSRPELEMIITLWEKNHEAFMNMAAGKLRAKPLSEIGFLIQEVKERKDIIIHADIFADIVATIYIREDEIGEPYNEKIHEQKKAAFREAKKKDFDPFYLKGLDVYLPLLKSMPEELKASSLQSYPRIKAFQEMMKNRILEAG